MPDVKELSTSTPIVTSPVVSGTSPTVSSTSPVVSGTSPVVSGTSPTVSVTSPTVSGTSPTVSVSPIYTIDIPPKVNFNVNKRQVVVNGQVIGIPLNQPQIVVDLERPPGKNEISIEDYCFTSLCRNIAITV